MSADPITRQRSPWEADEDFVARFRQIGLAVAAYRRRVADGELRAAVDESPLGWHLSISFVDHKDRPTRYPTWDEITHARDQLLPGDVAFVMHLPIDSEYVAVHPTMFHLHEHPERQP